MTFYKISGIVVSTKKLELLFEEKENYTWVFWVHHETFSHVRKLKLYLRNNLNGRSYLNFITHMYACKCK